MQASWPMFITGLWNCCIVVRDTKINPSYSKSHNKIRVSPKKDGSNRNEQHASGRRYSVIQSGLHQISDPFNFDYIATGS